MPARTYKITMTVDVATFREFDRNEHSYFAGEFDRALTKLGADHYFIANHCMVQVEKKEEPK